MRFLLVDRITSLDRGKQATAIKNVTMSEDFFTHHFPDHPIMPGALILECLVQLADWVLRESSDFELVALAGGFERVKFQRMVHPGDSLHLRVNVVEQSGTEALIRGEASCEGKTVSTALFRLTLHPAEAFHAPEEARKLFRILTTPESLG